MHVLILPFSSPRNFWNFFPFSFFFKIFLCFRLSFLPVSCKSNLSTFPVGLDLVFFSYSVFILLSSYYYSNFCCRLSSIETALSSNLPSGDNFLRIRVGIRERISLGLVLFGSDHLFPKLPSDTCRISVFSWFSVPDISRS